VQWTETKLVQSTAIVITVESIAQIEQIASDPRLGDEEKVERIAGLLKQITLQVGILSVSKSHPLPAALQQRARALGAVERSALNVLDEGALETVARMPDPDLKEVVALALDHPSEVNAALKSGTVNSVAELEAAVKPAAAPVIAPMSRGDVNGVPVPSKAVGEVVVEPRVDPTPQPISPKHGYTGEWPPAPAGQRPTSNATPAEMADWRYRRYARDQYESGKQAHEILTPEGYGPHAKTAATPDARPGRGGGKAQKGVREGPAKAAGFENTETTQLGTRWSQKLQRVEKNMVDGVKLNSTGGTDYLEVDKINKNGLPNAGYRDKLKTEIAALKKGDSLEFWDKADPSRRIRYEFGDSPDVVDTRKAN